MRVFLTGATGFIGSALVPELIEAGHQVLGLARSDAGAQQLTAAGAQVHRGDLKDLASLRSGAAQADAVIHTAFIHDFTSFQENCETDQRAILAMGDELAGSDRLMIVTSGTGLASAGPGQVATEDAPPTEWKGIPRVLTEHAVAAVATRGVRVATVRLPQVHDTVKQGLVSYAIQIARQKRISAYIGEGLNRWPAAHRFDVSHLYRLALDKGEGDVRYHAVAEEGVPVRDIAEVIGRGLNVPVASLPPDEAAAHFGWLAAFAGMDSPASSVLTRAKLGWNPVGPTLLTDLANMDYSKVQ